MRDVHLTMVHKVQDCSEVCEGNALEIEERMCMWIVSEDSPEERRAGGQYDLVGLHLSVPH